MTPYLVDVIVCDDTVNPIQVEEIWSDSSTVVRDIAPNELDDHKCGPSLHCTNNTAHCRVLPEPVNGRDCYYCTSGTTTENFCWPVKKKVCSTVQTTITCGTRMKATCVANPLGYPTCTGGTAVAAGTCTLEECVPYVE